MEPPGPEASRGAVAAGAPGSSRWRWAVLLVASVHLLTTAGGWYVTDHAEYLFVARRLLDHGTFELAEPRVRRIEALPWLVAPHADPLRTRLLPATPVTLVPLLAADRALGLEDPQQYGIVVHLQGHLFVLPGLFVLGLAVRRRGASDAAAAVTVALTGFAWPVWLVARRIGPEPILLFLVCLWLAAGTWAEAGHRRAAALTQSGVCALLPWANPTGSVVGLALVAASLFDAWLDGKEKRTSGDRLLRWAPAGGLILGVSSLMLGWNRLYHGDWWLGGYAPYATVSFFGVKEPLAGLALHVSALFLEGPVILLLAFSGLRAAGHPRARGLTLALFLTTALLLLFATFFQPEASRRLAVVWPCWAMIVGRTWDRLGLRGPSAQALLAAAFLVGCYWLIRNEGRYHLGLDGLYYPNIVWIKLLVKGASAWRLAPAGVLALLLLASAAKTWRFLRLPSQSCGQA